MFKHVFASVAICQMMTVAIAQQKTTFKVVDEKSSPLTNATVILHNQVQKTNHQGEVVFSTDSRKDHTVRVKHLGYKEYTKKYDLLPPYQTIHLELTTIQTDAVFVYATRAKDNAATTFKNLNKEEIKKNNLGQDVPYLLDQTPGVIIGSDAGAGIGYTSMTIRGSDNQRINVTLNGIPLNDAESMGSFFVNLPDFASSTESIQIQRGIGTSTNGAGAFGASLNIQTDALETKPYAEFNNSYGSYNSWKNTIKAGTGLINNKFAFNTRLSRISSNGYVERATSNLKSMYFDGGLYTNKHILKATVFTGKEKTYQAWYGTPEPLIKGDRTDLERYANNNFGLYSGAEFERLMNADRRYNYYTYDNQTDNYKQTHSHLHYTYVMNNAWNFNAALHYTRGAGYYEEFREDDRLSRYSIPNLVQGSTTIEKSNLVRRRWLDNHFYGTTVSANFKPSTTWNLTFGGAYNEYKGDHYGEVIKVDIYPNTSFNDKYYLNDATKKDFNTYLKADYRRNNWLINLDVQYRNVNYRSQGDDDKIKDFGFKDNLHFINPKVGATYFLSANANLYASYAYASKEPVRKDYVENPRSEFPKPERMQNIEAGYRYRNETFNIGTNFYAMLYKDQLVPTGQLNDTGSELRMNIPDSYRIGWELDASWIIHPKFIWSATAALSDNKIKNFVEYVSVLDDNWEFVREEQFHYKSTQIAKAANTILSNNLTYLPTDKWSISLMSKYVSRVYLDNSSAKERSIDPFTYTNLKTQYSFSALGIKNIDVLASINNIFNAKYETSGYTWGQIFESQGKRDFYNFYYPQATTNFMFGLNLRF
ncbi:TonB-dependent receptor [Sphingobacterium bovistauri]|uniref:TonB-dependent receptor n=1 Tax=Sphingobacterium bovistauri TaxID=2781959 RepID=A0ABS7Z4L1_9SPHI|nr:TonB-dependent receptor [Sphingobacterium bovistauri]MCA5004331.1 TonB-dependent receptor [Sphingobacterium bovistauri]